MTQLLVALSRGIYLGGVGGTANALTATVPGSVTVPALLEGMKFSFKAALNNTAGATLNIAGFGAKNIVHKDGTALKSDELQAGQIAEVIYDGINFQFSVSYGRRLSTQVFTASGTYTPTPGMAFCIVRAIGGGGAGAGGGGAGAGNVSMGAGGGASGEGIGMYTAAQIGASKAVTIGAGGVAASNTAGGNGGTTSLGSLLTVPGGIGGGLLNNQAPPSVNGNGTTSTAPTGANIAAISGTSAGVTLAVSSTIGYSAPGGNTSLGGGGYSKSINSTGQAGGGYGSGGAGILLNQSGGSGAGGNGAPGIMIIEEYSL